MLDVWHFELLAKDTQVVLTGKVVFLAALVLLQSLALVVDEKVAAHVKLAATLVGTRCKNGSGQILD